MLHVRYAEDMAPRQDSSLQGKEPSTCAWQPAEPIQYVVLCALACLWTDVTSVCPPALVEEVKHVRIHSAVEFEVPSNTLRRVDDGHIIASPVHLRSTHRGEQSRG